MESESDEEEIGVVESDCSNDEAVWLLTNMQATSSHFQGFTPSELEVLVTKMLVLCLKGGEPLMSQGEESTFYALMLSGEAKIVVQGEDKSTPPVTVASLKAGEIIGEMALFDGGVRSATVTCIEEENVVAIMHFDNLKALISSHPELGMKLVKQALSISVQRLTTKNVVDEDFDLTHGSPDQIQAMIRHFEKTTLVEELDSKQLKLLSTHLSVCSFEKGDPIIKKGNKSRYLLILVKGEAAVYAESQLLATINKTGSFLGESIMYTAVRKANVVAHTNCTFCVLPLWNLESLSMEDPQLVLSIITILVRRNLYPQLISSSLVFMIVVVGLLVAGRDILSQLRSTHGIKEPEEPKPAPVDKKSGKKKGALFFPPWSSRQAIVHGADAMMGEAAAAPRESKGQKKMEGVLASRKPGKPGGEGDKEKEKKPKELTAAQYKTKMLSERAMREAAEKNLQALQVQFKALGGIMPGEGTPDGEKEGARRSANEPFDGEVELMEMLEQKTLIAQALHKSVAEKEERIATLEAENEVAALGLTKLEEVVESLRKENQALSDVLEGAGGQMEMAQQKAIAHQRDRWTALEQDFLESVIQAEWDLVQFMVELTTGIEVDLNDWEKKLRISSKKGWISALEEVMQMVESAFDDLCLQYTTLVRLRRALHSDDLCQQYTTLELHDKPIVKFHPNAMLSMNPIGDDVKKCGAVPPPRLALRPAALIRCAAWAARPVAGIRKSVAQIQGIEQVVVRFSHWWGASPVGCTQGSVLGRLLQSVVGRLLQSVVGRSLQSVEEEEKQNRLLSDAQRRLNELEGSKGAKLNKDMKARVDDLTAQLEKETKISVDLSEKLIQKDDERLIQEKLVAVKDRKMDTMQMELSTKARQLEEEKASGAEVMSGLVELEKVVKERNEQIDAQQADMERLSSQLAAVRAEAEDLRQKNTDLGEELRQMQIHDINT
eukprot:gene14443-17072_t